MNHPHSTVSYPAKSVHTVLASLAGSFDAVLRRPEYLPYTTAVDIVIGQLQTVANEMDLNAQEKQAFDELRKKFLDHWNSLRSPH